MINPWVLLGIALAWAGSCWYAYDKGGEHRENAIIATQKKTQDVITATVRTARQEIGAEVAGKLGSLQIVNRTINKATVHEIVEKPVYRDPNCAVPESGVVQLNAARRGDAGGAGPGADAGKSAGSDVRLKPPAASGGSGSR